MMALFIKVTGFKAQKKGKEERYLQVKMCLNVNGKKGKKKVKELKNLIF